jgi:amino acid adenylation domain-containing protein
MAQLLQDLLRLSAECRPENEAVRMDGVGMSYEGLQRASDQLAMALIDEGVRRGDRVGIFLQKSPASVISVFGIMKAGAVYVPLDPNAPGRRLSYIANDCAISCLLTSPSMHEKLATLLDEGAPIETVIWMEESDEAKPCLSRDIKGVSWSDVTNREVKEGRLPPSIDTDLAYILYTSGSTGEPKGVMISHRTILTFVNWCVRRFELTHKDRVTSHAPLHFDLSTFDLYATVAAGGTIVLVGENLSTLPAKLADLLQDEQITITYLVPSILSMMVRYGKLDAHDFASLRIVLFAGEVFPIKYLRGLTASIRHAAFYNLYGPTETNVCTYYRVEPEDVAPDRTEAVPIGQACENIDVFAVDEQGERVTQAGREGELWARGSCVAQGYWGDREKTAASFVQNPFNTLFPDVAYRTGDIVKLAPDQRNWIFVGRRDHMIKSRGYRIELGEIESAFYRHQQVKEAAVVAIPDDLLGTRLRAFVVSADGESLTTKELMAFCSNQLPKYMIPEHIELCDVIPKTSTGKIDRSALLKQYSE